MKKHLFTLLMLLSMPLMASAQQHHSALITIQGNTRNLDVRSLIPQAALSPIPTMHKAPAVDDGTGTEAYHWIDRIQNLPTYMHDFYTQYQQAVSHTLDAQPSWISDPTQAINIHDQCYGRKLQSYSRTVAFDIPAGATQDVVNELAQEAISRYLGREWDEADTFMHYLCMSLTYDLPEAFWMGNYFRWSDSWSYRYSWSGTKASVTYDHSIYFVLKDSDFDIRRSAFRTSSKVLQAVPKFHSAVATILDGIPQGSYRYESLLHCNNWLTQHNYYNPYYYSNQATDMVWSAYGALCGLTGKDAPVCESYAKAFNVLCNKLDIPCRCVVGYAKGSPSEAGESHMWNEVQMEDGQWYAVDVTWNDPIVNGSNQQKVTGYESDFWFLLGSRDQVSRGFTFAQSHPCQMTWDLDSSITDQWDVDITSLIAPYRDQFLTSLQAPSTPSGHPSLPLRVTDLNGRHLGILPQHRGIIILNGRKVLR